MPLQTPQTFAQAGGGAYHAALDLHTMDVEIDVLTGMPTYDANFNVVRTVNTQVPKVGDLTGIADIFSHDYSKQLLSYLLDVWTETANRYAPGVDGAEAVLSGINPAGGLGTDV